MAQIEKIIEKVKEMGYPEEIDTWKFKQFNESQLADFMGFVIEKWDPVAFMWNRSSDMLSSKRAKQKVIR